MVLNIALDCDTLEEYVVYQSLQNKKAWVRKHCDFVSLVDKEKYPEEKNKYRFTEIKKIRKLNSDFFNTLLNINHNTHHKLNLIHKH